MEGTTAVTTTPTSTGSEAISAPATASVGTTTASTPIDPGQRPTFAQAFAADAAAQAPTATAQPEGAATEPAETVDPQSAVNPSTDKQGPIPLAVHTKALENARVKAVEEFRQTAGIDKAVDFSSRINASATGFWKDYTTELLSHPEHGGALRSELARMFGGLRQPAAAVPAAPPQAEPMPKPDVQVVDAQGNVTGMTYSDKQLDARDAWREKQAEQRSQAKADQQKAAEAAHAERVRQVQAKSDDVMDEIAEILDGDKSHFRTLNQVMADNPTWTAHKAALHVRNTVIKPAQAGKAQAEVLETLKTKAAAQTVNPAGAAPASTHRPKSFMDKSLTW